MQSDEGRLNDEVRMARQAKETLESDGFKLAFAQVEGALLTAMQATAIQDDKLRLRLLDKYESLHALKNCLQSMVDTGVMASEEIRQIIERKKTFAEKVKDFVGV